MVQLMNALNMHYKMKQSISNTLTRAEVKKHMDHVQSVKIVTKGLRIDLHPMVQYTKLDNEWPEYEKILPFIK